VSHLDVRREGATMLLAIVLIVLAVLLVLDGLVFTPSNGC
jgi:hypothetical protein